MKMDDFITSRLAERLAVKEYLEADVPSSACINYLGKNLNGLRKLSGLTSDFYKNDINGNSILKNGFWLHNLEYFKCMVDKGFDFNRNQPNLPNWSYLTQIRDEKQHLQYLLNARPGCVSSISVHDQHLIWSCIATKEEGEFLKSHGFDINMINTYNGRSVLYNLITHLRIFEEDDQKDAELARILLDCGADPTLTLTYNGEEMNAIELARRERPAVYQVLSEYNE